MLLSPFFARIADNAEDTEDAEVMHGIPDALIERVKEFYLDDAEDICDILDEMYEK